MKKKILPIISFCGMDGSGKTTLAKLLVDFFERQGFLVEFKHGHGYAVSQDSFGLSDRQIADLKLFFTLVSPLTIFDHFFTFYFRYHQIRKRKVLICDRYFYDKLARMVYYGICNKPLAKFYLSLLPKPDCAFFLDVGPSQARIRKKEYSQKEYESFREIYRFIAQSLSAPIIDTARQIDLCWQEIHGNLKKQKII